MLANISELERHIASRLRERREAFGLSRDELAERIGTSVAELRLFEAGAKKIPPRRLVQAAETLKTPLSWFLEGPPAARCVDGMSQTSAELARFLAMPEAYALISAFIAISCPKRRQAIVDFSRMESRKTPPDCEA